MDEGFLCSNGIDWSTDGEWLFFVDSRRDAIFRYRYDVDTGSIGKRGAVRRHAQLCRASPTVWRSTQRDCSGAPSGTAPL